MNINALLSNSLFVYATGRVLYLLLSACLLPQKIRYSAAGSYQLSHDAPMLGNSLPPKCLILRPDNYFESQGKAIATKSTYLCGIWESFLLLFLPLRVLILYVSL